jgi:hypothetical protein
MPCTFLDRAGRGRGVMTVILAWLLGVCIECAGAFACPVASQMSTIIFEERDLAAGIDGPAIIEITTTGFTDTAIVARVEKVLKGQIGGATINIVANFSSCLLSVPVGVRGIVVGSLRRDDRGALELRAMEETFAARDQRRESKDNK